MNILNVSNVLGIVLLYMPNISIPELESICDILKEKGYEIDVDDSVVYSVLEEWRDFFSLNYDGNICLTKSLIRRRHVIKALFSNSISAKANNDIFNAMLNRSHKRSKIIRFNK